MSAAFRTLANLIIIKANPQDLPTSGSITCLFAGLMFSCVFASILILGQQVNPFSHALFDVFFLVVFVKVLLVLFRVQERFNQTASAMFGISFVFTAVQLPLHLQLRGILGEQGSSFDPQLFVDSLPIYIPIINVVLFIFFMRVLVHIFRQAVGVSTSFAFGLALLYIIGNLLTEYLLLGI